MVCKGEISSKAKLHISLGHETVLAKVILFQGGGYVEMLGFS